MPVITIRNCHFETWDNGIYLLNTDSSTLINNTYTTINNYGIILKNSNNNILSDSQIYTAISNTGILLNQSSNNLIQYNSLDDIGDYGIFLQKSNNNTISNNLITDVTTHQGIYFDSSSNNTIADNTISNTPIGMYLDYDFPDPQSSYNNISNNAFYQNGDGIDIFSDYNTVIGNEIKWNGLGISVQADSNILANNLVNNNRNYGISIGGDGNVLTNNTANNDTNAFYLGGGYGYNTFTNNSAYNNSYAGFNVNSGDSVGAVNNTFIGNVVKNNGRGFYFVRASEYNRITNNIADNNSYCGICLISRYKNSTIANNIVSNSKYGIMIDSCSNDVLANNTIYNSGLWDFISNGTTASGLFGTYGNIVTNMTFNNTAVDFTYGMPIYIKYSNGAGASDPVGYKNITHYLNITGTTIYARTNKTFGTANSDKAYSVQQATDGGFVMAGQMGGGTTYMWLIKTDAALNHVWNKTFGGGFGSGGRSVQQTSDGGYIVAGYYDPSSNDVYLVKTNSSGDKDWDKAFDYGGGSDKGFSVQQTSDGGYIVAGDAYLGNPTYFDVWLIKTNSTGGMTWNKTFDANKSSGTGDRAYSVQQTSDGGYILTGYADLYGAGGLDVWLIKTNSTGGHEWNKTFGGTSDDEGWSVQQTTDNGYIIAGRTKSFGAGNNDVWLIKTDSNGVMTWNKTFGGAGSDDGYSVQQTSDGGYIVAGDKNATGNNVYDVWLIKTNSTGGPEWNKTYGGSSSDIGYSVDTMSDGGYAIAGSTASFGAGSDDAWLITTDSFGSTNIEGLYPWINLNISYSNSDVSGINESSLAIARNNGTWEKNTSKFANNFGVDTANNVVYANITGFGSVFAPLGMGMPVTNVSDCINITTPGSYALIQDISNSGAVVCINITADNVEFSGNGHIVDGVDNLFTRGVYVDGANVTVKNLTLTDWNDGVRLNSATNVSITNSNISSCREGAYIQYSVGSNFISNIIQRNTIQNVELYHSNQSTFVSNSIDYVGSGADSFGIDTGTNLILLSNTFNNNGESGVVLNEVIGAVLVNNTANNNLEHGIELYSNVHYANLTSNTANNNSDGFHMDFSENLTITNNVANNNTWYGIVMAYDTYSVVINNTANNNYAGFFLQGNNAWPESMLLISNTAENNGVHDLEIWSSMNNTFINTTITNQDISYFTSSGDIGMKGVTIPPADPANYRNISAYINATDLGTDAWLFLNISYSDLDIVGFNESKLAMARNNGTWEKNTSKFANNFGVDTANNVVYANITGFGSIFAPLGATKLACFNITVPGYHSLTEDLSGNQSNGRCIDIQTADVVLDCNGHNITGSDSSGTQAVYANNINNVTIKNCTLIDYDYAIDILGTNNTIISNNRVYSSSNIGIYAGSGENLTLELNEINDTGGWSYGAYIISVKNILFYKNTFSNNNYGINLDCNSEPDNCTRVTADSNTITGATYSFLGYNVNNMTFTNNNFYNNGWAPTMYTTSNFKFISNNLTGDTYYGLAVQNSRGSTTISSNQIIDNAAYGISCDTCENLMVNSNTLTNNSVPGSSSLVDITSSPYANITLNNVTNNRGDGTAMEISSSSYSSITSNNIMNNTLGGIGLFSPNITVQNNIVSNNRYGLYLSGASNSNIENNIANNNTVIGIGVFEYSSGTKSNIILKDNTAKNNAIWDMQFGQSENNTITNQTLTNDQRIDAVCCVGYVDIKGDVSPANDPANFHNASRYINVSSTALNSGIYLNITYNEADLGGYDEGNLTMARWNGTWETNTAAFANPYGVNIVANYVYANITKIGSIFAPLSLNITPAVCNLSVLIDGVSTNAFANAGQPYNVTVTVNKDGSPLAAKVRVKEWNGYSIFVMPQYQVSNVTNYAYGEVDAGTSGVSVTAVPTGGWAVNSGAVGDYNITVEAIDAGVVCDSKNISVTNRNMPSAGVSAPQVPNLDNIRYFADRVAVAYMRIKDWLANGGGENKNIVIWTNGTNPEGLSFTVKAGEPYGLNITVRNATGVVAGAKVTIEEKNGFPPFILPQYQISNVTNHAVGETLTDANGNVRFTIVPTGGVGVNNLAVGGYNISINIYESSVNKFNANLTCTGSDCNFPDASTGQEIPNIDNIRYFNDKIAIVYIRIKDWLTNIGG